MTVYLLDVNAIISLLWPSHIHHADTQQWFARRAKSGWATSSLTQAGFVRIVSNPSFSKDAVTPAEALGVLAANMRHPQHRFLVDDIGFAALVQPLVPNLIGHRQVSDAYLLGLALRHNVKLATLDTGIASLLPNEKALQAAIELIPTAN